MEYLSSGGISFEDIGFKRVAEVEGLLHLPPCTKLLMCHIASLFINCKIPHLSSILGSLSSNNLGGVGHGWQVRLMRNNGVHT